MMTLKDIKVSKNPIPVQPALWLRPMGGLSFKIYYPQGGNWVEVMTKSTPASEQPETPASEAPATQIDEGTLQSLEQTIETLRQAINTLQNTVTNTSKSVMAASINGQSAIQTLLQDEGILVLPSFPLTFKEVHEADLPDYNLTGELMDALFSRRYRGVEILGLSLRTYNGRYGLSNIGKTVVLTGLFDNLSVHNGKIEVKIRIKRESVSETDSGLVFNGKPSAAYTYTVTVSTKTTSITTPEPGGPIEPMPGGSGSLDPGAGPSSGNFNGGSSILP